MKKDTKIKKNKVYRKILVLPDTHAPWIDWKAMKEAKKWADKNKPDLVIQLGDLTDQKIWSRWQNDTDDFCPSKEFDLAEKEMNKLHKMFPEMVILRGNHDERVKTKAIENGIPGKMFNDVNEVFDFEGWKWVERGEHIIVKTPKGKIHFMHGDEMGGNPAQKSRILGMSIIQGHTHKASITYTKTPENHFFGAEMGCLIDTPSKATRYAQANPVGISIGFGVVEDGVPKFISC